MKRRKLARWAVRLVPAVYPCRGGKPPLRVNGLHRAAAAAETCGIGVFGRIRVFSEQFCALVARPHEAELCRPIFHKVCKQQGLVLPEYMVTYCLVAR